MVWVIDDVLVDVVPLNEDRNISSDGPTKESLLEEKM